MTLASSLGDPLASALEALGGGAWPEAREAFEEALRREESAEAWEGLGWAGWWLCDAELTLRAREAAYRRYRGAGRSSDAGRVAAWLAADYAEFLGKDAVARGWLERAHRMLDGRPESVDHGWLALHEASFALAAGDAETASRLAATGTRLGREFGVADLEAIGLALEGITLVVRGAVEDGMRYLDEGAVVASGEELELPVSAAWAHCYLISACAGVGDLPRAAHWCEVMQGWATRWGSRTFLGVCRASYGQVLCTGGDWTTAESELTAAVADLEAARPGMASRGLIRLAELRARQGRVEEARLLFERAGVSTPALVGLGGLALDHGDALAASDAAERALRRLPETAVLERVPGLELLVRARCALGELDAAAAAYAMLDDAARRLGTSYLVGRSHLVAGELALSRGTHEEARREAEDALDCFVAASAPYDAARARLVLARALAGLGRDDAAAGEARAARATFVSLGAERDTAGADALISAAPRGGGPRAQGALSPRELEVLRLVAEGLSDSEIAQRLVVSPHTVHRHVANVRRKLRLPSRAAAVAYALKEGLLEPR